MLTTLGFVLIPCGTRLSVYLVPHVQVHDNVGYGFDPHDDSDYVTINNNHVYNNGWHGISEYKHDVTSKPTTEHARHSLSWRPSPVNSSNFFLERTRAAIGGV